MIAEDKKAWWGHVWRRDLLVRGPRRLTDGSTGSLRLHSGARLVL